MPLTSGMRRLMDGMLLNSMAFRQARTAALVDDWPWESLPNPISMKMILSLLIFSLWFLSGREVSAIVVICLEEVVIVIVPWECRNAPAQKKQRENARIATLKLLVKFMVVVWCVRVYPYLTQNSGHGHGRCGWMAWILVLPIFWREECVGQLNSTHFFGGKSGTIKFDAHFCFRYIDRTKQISTTQPQRRSRVRMSTAHRPLKLSYYERRHGWFCIMPQYYAAILSYFFPAHLDLTCIVVGCVMCASVLLSLCRGLDICGGISRGGGCTIMGPIHEWARPIYGSDYLLVQVHALDLGSSTSPPCH